MRPQDLTISHIANALNTTPDKAFEISQNMDLYLKGPFNIYRKGKCRKIYKPKYPFIYKLKNLHRSFQKWGFEHSCVHGGVKGKSCVTAAILHIGNKSQATRDIKDCYPSISRDMLYHKLEQRGFDEYVASLLSNLMTINNAVPQGSPISSDAMNLYLYNIDQKLASEAGKLNAVYTRTYDDMVASSRSPRAVKRLAHTIDFEVSKNALKINEKKKEKNGYRSPNETRTVHNIVVTSPKGLKVTQKHTEDARSNVCNYLLSSKSVTPRSIYALIKKRHVAMGWVRYVESVNPKHGKHLKQIAKTADHKALKCFQKNIDLSNSYKWWLFNNGPFTESDTKIATYLNN